MAFERRSAERPAKYDVNALYHHVDRQVQAAQKSKAKLVEASRTYNTAAHWHFYQDLTRIKNGGDSIDNLAIGTNMSLGKKFTEIVFNAYGQVPGTAQGEIIYQRLVAYYQGERLLGLVHAYDPGDAHGPGDDDATITSGMVFEHRKGETRLHFWSEGNPQAYITAATSEQVEQIDGYYTWQFEDLAHSVFHVKSMSTLGHFALGWRTHRDHGSPV
jgi:hypothetical protein